MNDAGDVAQDRQEDIDQQVGAAATLEEHTERRKDDGKNDLANVACLESHGEVLRSSDHWKIVGWAGNSDEKLMGVLA